MWERVQVTNHVEVNLEIRDSVLDQPFQYIEERRT